MHRDGDVVPRGAEEVVAEARRGGEADGVEHTVDAAPLVGDRLAHRLDVLGHGDVELEHVDAVAQLARGALRQAERPPGAGEHDLGALLERDLGHAVGQRGVGQHAGDHDLLALEQSHARAT